jgi:hypothetical protein
MIEDPKEYAMETPERSIRLIVEKHNDAGIVMWDASPPPNTPFVTHVQVTLMQAIETCLMFAETDGLDEWIVAGPLALSYLRALTIYSEIGVVQERLECGIVRCGRLHSKMVYSMRRLEVADAMVGHFGGKRCTRLIFQNTSSGRPSRRDEQ